MATKRYDDKFRAGAVVTLQANGYPEKQGALMRVAKELGVPHTTLRRWYTAESNPPPNEIVQEKKEELKDLFEIEMRAIFVEMGKSRQDANYRDLGTVLGIIADKHQLLTGKPTDRIAVDDNLTDEQRANRITALLERARARRDGQSDSR